MKKFLKFTKNWQTKLIYFFLVAVGCILYINLGRDALFDWDEGIYAELGRQVVVTKDLFITHWNGAPWLEKPPGIAWISALGIALAGPSAFGARLLMPLFALYTLYMVYRIGKHLGSWQHGIIAAGVLAGLNLFLGRTRAVNTDMPLLASITTTILFLLENRPARWVALSIFGGVWFKGVAGLLSVIIALPLFLSKSKKYLLTTIGYCALLVLPWHLYAYLRYGSEFTTPYFFEQVLRRATAQIEFHFEPRWYYFTYLYENLGLGVILVSIVGANILLYKLLRKNKEQVLRITLLWWAIAPLMIFTLAKTRLFWYILPIYPALALLISEALAHWQNAKMGKTVVSILAIGILVQGLLQSTRSVEVAKVTAPFPDRLQVVQSLGKSHEKTIAVLVPPSERLSEALLPEVARLSSSFRYGGMPSVVFYYGGPVRFFYDVDKFRAYWMESSDPLALVAVEDKSFIPEPFQEIVVTGTYLGVQKGVYAQR